MIFFIGQLHAHTIFFPFPFFFWVGWGVAGWVGGVLRVSYPD